jgi:hypothetical protein
VNIRIRRLHPVLLALLITLVQLGSAPARSQDLEELFRGKKYFDLRDRLRHLEPEQSAERDFYHGAVANKFNQPRLSISNLKSYLKKVQTGKDEGLLVKCYELLADNYQKTNQYSLASETYATLLTKLRDKITVS